MPETISRKADGSSGGSVSLSEKLFNAKINPGLMHQAVVNEATNSRQDTRDTKTRAEVAGGGRKPYRQKGTGRARQGTISAPHYRHGGIVFGPHPRDLSAKLPKKARRAALASALSTKTADDAIIVTGQPDNGDTFHQDSGGASEDAWRHGQSAGRAAGCQPDHLQIVPQHSGHRCPGRAGVLRAGCSGCGANHFDSGRVGQTGLSLRRCRPG